MSRHKRNSSFALLAILTLSGACSLHSIEYLGAAGEDSSAGGEAPQGGKKPTSSSGSSSSDAGRGAQGSASPQGGSDSQGGTNAQGSTSAQGGKSVQGGADTMGEAGASPAVPDCNDSDKTVDETDIDCGGRTCEPCPANKKCVNGTDCQSGICTNQTCQAPTCTDIAVNGDETDLNCGGKCSPCALGKHCQVNADCSTKQCTEGMCESTACQEGVLQDGCPLLIDNTAYSLSPAHAPTRCIDDNKQSVTDGTAQVLYTCKVELHQTFWAVAQADGYFALRNALSAKCLQVKGASTAENALVEQGNCDLSADQLWKPSRFDSSLMVLTNKLSNLVLDVAGASVDADFQGITQGKVDGATDTHWRMQKRTTAAYIALSPSDSTANRMHHEGSTLTLTPDDLPSAQWRVVPGLSDVRSISFQSRDEPGRYLRHAAFRIWSDTNDGSATFQKDATFHYATPLAGGNALTKSLEADSYPGYFMTRTDAATIKLLENTDTAFKAASATWTILPR